MRLLFSVLLLITIAACSVKEMPPFPEMRRTLADRESLWQMRLEHRGRERFSGILALRSEENNIRMVLLDSTGIKLMEAVVGGNHKFEVVYAMKIVQDHNLPEYLCRSLEKIFLETPDELPCSGGWLYRLCRYAVSDGHGRKRASWGPIPLWKVDFLVDTSHPLTMKRAVLDSPWPGPKLILDML